MDARVTARVPAATYVVHARLARRRLPPCPRRLRLARRSLSTAGRPGLVGPRSWTCLSVSDGVSLIGSPGRCKDGVSQRPGGWE